MKNFVYFDNYCQNMGNNTTTQKFKKLLTSTMIGILKEVYDLIEMYTLSLIISSSLVIHIISLIKSLGNRAKNEGLIEII